MSLQLYQGKKLQGFLAVLALATVAIAAPASSNDFEIADRVVVKKSERKLLLMKDGRILKSSDIALGLVPEGHKEREGDFRTPEGNYRLIERNADSDYFLSIQISYPNPVDNGRAKARGESPGGQIMIHGQPNSPAYSPEYYRRTDWTNGCIAVSNSDMVDIWLMTALDTPIQILP